jgi:cytochrome d ubiquinol oxidase subunit I
MLLASALTCAFLLAGLSAWQLLRGVAQRSAPRVLRVGLTLAAIAIPLQILVGDAHGLNTLEHQPAKIAAMEGVWDTERGAPLLLFAIPDKDTRSNHFEIKVPKLASLILTHELDGEIQGLNAFGDKHPPPLPLFFAFRIMVGVGLLMLATSWLGWWLYRRAQWQASALPRALLWLFAGMTFSGWVATVAGWYVTEIGRQPFIVYGLIRTADVVSAVPSALIGLTLALYITLYLALIVAYVTVLKYMAEKPEEVFADDARDQAGTPAGAMSSGVVT